MEYFVAITFLGKSWYPNLIISIAQADKQSMITHFLIKKKCVYI